MSLLQTSSKIMEASIWSNNFAYGIGLIASDGNLSRDGRHIRFTSKDLELVKNFSQALGIRNKIGIKARGGEVEKKYFYIDFSDKALYRFLLEIGITPAKSKTIGELKVPDHFFGDFLRGVFDGDGTFYTSWDTRWPNSFVYQLSIASASETFVLWLKNKLTVLYGVKGFIRPGAGVYNIRYSKGDTRIIFKIMYAGAKLFLGRKNLKMKKAFEFDIALQ